MSTMAESVRASLEAADLGPLDGAAAALALRYAAQIDEWPGPEALSVLGPKLMIALARLGLTPTSRAAVPAGAGPAEPLEASPLDAIKDEVREQRERHRRAIGA